MIQQPGNDDVVERSYRPPAAPKRFPAGTLIGFLVIYLFWGAFVFRLSQTGGETSQNACIAAIGVTVAAAAGGIVALYKVWHKEMTWVIFGIFVSGLIRLLISLVGVAIILFFTAIDRTQFVWFLALFYVAFLALDGRLALMLLRQSVPHTNDQESAVHGNVWDIIVRSQSTRRGGQ